MKHSVRFISIALTFLFAVTIPTIGFAHPGRTDSKGGHTDKKTGEYHYHTKKSNSSSSSSSSSSSKKSSSSSKSNSTTFVTTQKTNLYSKADKDSESLGSISSDTTITALDKTDYFVKATVNGKTGYVRMKHLKVK